ncbi:flagellar protein FliS [Alkalithermobacter thermoalcaliphilus JW-YL-7 = DSM 7308]|uniref:Flagellar secretion chaperone FliS n=1 Tax=Alkalithermobacter thermoalcaliphilus JW-YL-7 = DSM 7308 TaxID=1121328 RepID=A0A150FPF9_CLOPD|nr:flagellar protein FliS [[Clostridium] paradoxum JW-YL-7 = DSM 7308]SHL06099.1 flagellar protein FliS [[Clostridium] paradoxum JW-YL-7 = DSM 7308]
MAMTNPYLTYQSQSINTATPEELTLKLYEGCIKFINLAIIGIEQKNIELANTNIIKAQNIINELNITLNMNYEISKTLRALYDYLYRRLVEANIKKDKKILLEVKEFVVEFRDTWKQAMHIARKGK